MKLDESTTAFDTAFRDIQGLTWLPWVGQRFPDRPPNQRLLVVGESHYFNGNTSEERQANCTSYLNDPQSTREIVSDSLVNRSYTTPTLTKIPKLAFDTVEIDHPKLWADCAYYNFVQRPMNHYEKDTPSGNDFVVGWRVFAEVARIIQPSHCLFIGVSAANYCNLGNITRHEQVDGVWPRAAKLNIEGRTTELIFVHHLGRCKNVRLWHDYLKAHHPDFMGWLGALSYTIDRNP